MSETNNHDIVKSSCSMETFSFKQGIKKFGQKLYEEIYGEMLHLH